MKTLRAMASLAAVLTLAQTAMAAPPSGPFRISALEKTVAKDKSEAQELPRGSTRLEEKKIVYRFEIQNQSTEFSQQDLKVRWVVMLERADGRSIQAAPGETTTVLPFGRPVVVETDVISLTERTWQGVGGRSGELGQVLRGYGLQILTQEGQLLMETYEPDSLKDDIAWQAAPGPARPSRRFVPPRGPLRAPLP